MKRILLPIIILIAVALNLSAASQIDKINQIADKIEAAQTSPQIYYTEKRHPKTNEFVSSSRYVVFEDSGKLLSQLVEAIKDLRSKATSYQVFTENQKQSYYITAIDGDYEVKVYLAPDGRKKWTLQISKKLMKK